LNDEKRLRPNGRSRKSGLFRRFGQDSRVLDVGVCAATRAQGSGQPARAVKRLSDALRQLGFLSLSHAGATSWPFASREAMQQVGDVPEVIAETVLKAATAAAPRRRYAAGKKARQTSFLRRFVPEAAFDKSLRKQMGLPV